MIWFTTVYTRPTHWAVLALILTIGSLIRSSISPGSVDSYIDIGAAIFALGIRAILVAIERTAK